MVFSCDDISKLLEMEDEIEQVSKQAGDVARYYYYVDEEIHASADRIPYEATNRKPTIDELVEEYAAKLDYLIAMRNLVKKNIKIDFYE
jgi:hypothetical protein